MNTEFEITFSPINKDEIRNKISGIWWICTKLEVLMKRVIYSNWENSYARIRDEWWKITCTYKEISEVNDINRVKEIETIVWNFNSMKSIFDKMWLVQKSYQETLREIWKIWNEIEFMIDTWPWLPPYLEIEWKNEEIVRKYVELLKFDYNNWIFWAVDEIYFREFWIEKNIINNLKEITFKNIPEIFKP